MQKKVLLKMNFILLLFVFHVLAADKYSEFQKYRAKRAEASKLSQLSTNHIKIARITNAIYLQKALSDGSLSPIDIVAGMWSFKDRRALEQLSKVGNLTSRLKELEEALKKVEVKLIDVEDMKKKLETLASVKPQVQKIRAAVDFVNFPKFAEYVSFRFLEETKQPTRCLSDTKATAASGAKLTGVVEAVECLLAIKRSMTLPIPTVIKAIEDFLKYSEEDRYFKTFIEGIGPVREYLKSYKAMRELGAQLTTVSDVLNSLKELLVMDFKETGKELMVVEQFLDEFQNNATENRIAVAFQKSQGLRDLPEDLKSTWILKVLNDGKSMQKLADSLKPLIDLSAPFGALSPSFQKLNKPFPSQLPSLFSSSEAVSLIASKIDGLIKLSQCFPEELPDEPVAVKEIELHSKQLSQMSAPLLKLSNALKQIKLSNDTMNRITKLNDWFFGTNRSVTQDIADIWKKMPEEITPYSTHLESAVKVWSGSEVLQKYKAMADLGKNVTEVKAWMKATHLLNTTKCPLQVTDGAADSLSELGNLQKTVESVKTKNMISDVTEMVEEMLKLSDGLMKLNKTQRANSELGLSFVAAQPSLLLDIAFGIHTLQKMSQVYEARDDLQKVIDAEPTVRAAISNVTDPDSLTTTWDKFSEVSTALADYSEALEALEAELKVPDGNESLADVEEVYRTAASVPFEGVIDLKPFSKSFRFFEAPDQGIKDLEKVFKSIDSQASGDWSLAPVSFNKVALALTGFKKQIDSFFATPQVDTDKTADKKSDKNANEGGLPMMMIVAGAGGFLILLLIVLIVFWWYCFKKHTYIPLKKYSMSKGNGEGGPEPPYRSSPDEDDWNYTYCKLQDIRLDINKRDANNCTPLYNAVMSKDWATVRKLLDQGALVDVNCGKNLRTCLHELVLMKDLEHGLWFLKMGAFDSQPAADGDTVFTWSDKNGFHQMFEEFKDTHKNKRVIPPNTPRPWNILVVNPHLLTRWQRRKLPIRVRNKITWGFDYDYKKTDLDQYTHIVMPSHYMANTHMIKLDDFDLFPYRCVASLANLMVESWIIRMLTDETVITNDQEYMIEACSYGDYQGSNETPFCTTALLELKTDLHKGHPKLLTNTRITILETKDPKMSQLKAEWEEVIELFGGTVHKVPIPDKGDNPQLPYQCGYNWYSNNRSSQNACWILRFDDSVIDPIWRSDKEGYTLVPFKFLPICIAGNYILNSSNEIVPLEYDEKSMARKRADKKSVIAGNTKIQNRTKSRVEKK